MANAWGQAGFAHASTVCATFAKLTPENVTELCTALDEVQAPLLQREVAALAGPDGHGLIAVDIDLSGQKVRGEAKQYTGTDFGYIKGALARGYQIAAAFLSGEHERFARVPSSRGKPTRNQRPASWSWCQPWRNASVVRSAAPSGYSSVWRSIGPKSDSCSRKDVTLPARAVLRNASSYNGKLGKL